MGGIIPVKTIEEIENYIEEQDQNGALLVTGKWGSGKTYLIRQIEKKLNQEPKYLMAVVSLFGIEDTNTLSKKVKEAVAYAQTFNKAEKSGKGHIAKGVNIAKQLSEKAAAFGVLFDFGKIKKIAKSANMLLSIDIHDFLPIEKEVYCIVAGEEQPVKKKLVLVFDDFERCKIGVIDLLGIINTYVEDKRIKTIVIASEDNIEDEENYKTFKEKVVERTVKLDMEYRRIQQEMIEDYKTETSEYKEFLKKESPKLFQVFEESGSRNLRTFKSCLIDFERVYGLWHSLKLPTDGMGEALYVFAAYLFEVKGGNYKKMDYLKNPTYERGLAAKSKILVCFNDELLAAFLSAYKKANISEQQEMLTILKEISFRGGAVERDETDTEVTRKNLEKLENALNSEVEHTSDAVKKFYANRHLETVKQIRQKFLNTREM